MRHFFALISAFLICCCVAFGSTINVPADYATIQAGIDIAQTGDTVLVGPGIWSGDGNRDLTFNGTNLILKSSDGPAVTTIDCGGSEANEHIAVFLDNGEDSTSIVEGFTVINAYHSGFSGAIFGLHAATKVRNCVVESNSTAGVTFSNYSTAGVIEDCVLANNTGSGVGYGGPDLYVRRTEIRDNDYYGVIGWGGRITMDDCLVANNAESGVHNASGAGPYVSLTNCTFVGNRIGLEFRWEAPKVTMPMIQEVSPITNCLFAYNREAGVHLDNAQYSFSPPVLVCCNSFGNDSGDYVTVFSDLDTTNCISAMPLFCDTSSGDYHIALESPCAPANSPCLELIGAFEAACDCCEQPGNIDHIWKNNNPIDVSDLTYLIDYLFRGGSPPPCPREGNANNSPDGQTNVSDLTYIVEFLFLGGPLPGGC